MSVFNYAIAEGDRLLNIQDVCKLLGVKKPYVYQLTHRKKIPYIKIQGIIRFRLAEVEAWLKTQEVKIGS